MSRVLAPPLPRPERLRQIRAALNRGLSQREVAAELGVSRSTVKNILYDPEGTKQRARRRSYGGFCLDCGAATMSDGTSNPSPRCGPCAGAAFHPKVWTREAVIDAIQRSAAANGRPPTASEWIASDPINGYPPRSSVYRSKTKSSAPFAKWSEALAAAGFPGSYPGRRTYKEVRTMSQERSGYVILHETDGGWKVVGESTQPTQVAALNEALTGNEPDGKWVAIPGRWWRPRELRPRTIFDWAEDVEAPVTA